VRDERYEGLKQYLAEKSAEESARDKALEDLEVNLDELKRKLEQTQNELNRKK
jgi:hypothetical protein